MITYDEIREKYLKYHNDEYTSEEEKTKNDQYVADTKFQLENTVLGFVRGLIVENENTGAVNNDSLLFSTNNMPSKVSPGAPNYKVYKKSDGKIMFFTLNTDDTDTSGKKGQEHEDKFVLNTTGGKRVNKTKRKKNKKNKKRKSNKRR